MSDFPDEKVRELLQKVKNDKQFHDFKDIKKYPSFNSSSRYR